MQITNFASIAVLRSQVTLSSAIIAVRNYPEVRYGDKFCIYVLAKDSLGYTHKILVLFWNDLDENTHNAVTTIDGSEQIYDSNGNLLTGGNE